MLIEPKLLEEGFRMLSDPKHVEGKKEGMV